MRESEGGIRTCDDLAEAASPRWRLLPLVSLPLRDGERTVLAFVGGDGQTIEVRETPQQIMELHLGPTTKA